jgi:hypothetical protein
MQISIMSLAIMFLIMVSSLSFDDILGQTFAALYIRAAKAGAESIIGSGILDAFCRGSTEIEYQIMYLAIITLPLLGSIASGLFGRKIGVTGSQLITSSLVILTTLLAIAAYFEVGLNSIPVSIKLFTWIDSESLNVFIGFHFDSLTVSMLIPVLIVSSLVHIYSIGYMSHDPHNQRFFSYLSLFT